MSQSSSQYHSFPGKVTSSFANTSLPEGSLKFGLQQTPHRDNSHACRIHIRSDTRRKAWVSRKTRSQVGVAHTGGSGRCARVRICGQRLRGPAS
jgi:hypothetical protein